MTWCDLFDLDRSMCVHGTAERRRTREPVGPVLISPRGYAHLEGCMHNTESDFTTWGVIDTPDPWHRLGNGEQLAATGGGNPRLIARERCRTCEAQEGPQ